MYGQKSGHWRSVKKVCYRDVIAECLGVYVELPWETESPVMKWWGVVGLGVFHFASERWEWPVLVTLIQYMVTIHYVEWNMSKTQVVDREGDQRRLWTTVCKKKNLSDARVPKTAAEDGARRKIIISCLTAA